MQIQKLIFLQTTGFYLGRSSEQSASLHQAGVIHLETHLGFLVPKKVGTEMLWGVDGVDMDWRRKVISTCQVMHFVPKGFCDCFLPGGALSSEPLSLFPSPNPNGAI